MGEEEDPAGFLSQRSPFCLLSSGLGKTQILRSRGAFNDRTAGGTAENQLVDGKERGGNKTSDRHPSAV